MVDKEIAEYARINAAVTASVEWHVPFSEQSITLRDALNGMSKFKLDPSDVPLIIQLIENPKYNLLGIFPGRTPLHSHDCIHILLGRGVLVKDEAFVIGFTMGSSHRMTTLRERIFIFCSRYLYPAGYKFNEDDARVFRNGIRLANIHQRLDLAHIDYEQYLDLPLGEVRQKIGLDSPLIKAYYNLEKKLYIKEKECQRLL